MFSIKYKLNYACHQRPESGKELLSAQIRYSEHDKHIIGNANCLTTNEYPVSPVQATVTSKSLVQLIQCN